MSDASEESDTNEKKNDILGHNHIFAHYIPTIRKLKNKTVRDYDTYEIFRNLYEATIDGEKEHAADFIKYMLENQEILKVNTYRQISKEAFMQLMDMTLFRIMWASQQDKRLRFRKEVEKILKKEIKWVDKLCHPSVKALNDTHYDLYLSDDNEEDD